MLGQPFHNPPYFVCPHCSTMVGHPEILAKGWLCGAVVPCPYCKALLDGWNIILDAIGSNFMLTQALVPFGCHTSVFTITMKPQKQYDLRFSDHGIPTDATILSINYTPFNAPKDFIVPLEMHGSYSIRHSVPNEITLYPAVLGAKSFGSQTKTQVYVLWVHDSSDDIQWSALIEACGFYVHKNYSKMIIPANTAVEAKLSKFIFEQLIKFIPKKTTNDFLKNGGTYSNQLNVVLPLVSQLVKLPTIPAKLLGLLNRLRALRNDIAHEGIPKAPLSQENSAELLCAALFGYYFIELAEAQANNGS